MESNKFGYWLQVGGIVGILAGLILVGLQMKQNSELLQLQLLRQEADSFIAAQQVYVGENFAEVWQKQIEEPENLTLAEMRIMESNLWGQSVYRWWKNYQLYERGLIRESDWKTPIDSDVTYVLNTEYGLAWWAEVKTPRNVFAEEFLDYIDQKLAERPEGGAEKFYQRVQNRITANRQ